MSRVCRVGQVEIGGERPLAIIAGPCVLESLELGWKIGTHVRDVCRDLGLAFVFKASFDKANRSSINSPRGPGLERGLSWMAQIRDGLGVPITTDVHEPSQAGSVARHADLVQIPAFLCRQTDLLMAAGSAAAEHGRGVNVKKGQFLSPGEMAGPLHKLAEAGCDNVIVTERGTFFGYNRLVNDFSGVADMMELSVKGRAAAPVCFDCTHSTQRPGAGEQTGGQPERAPALARAAVAVGVHAVFLECHPEPAGALSDSATMLRLDQVERLLRDLAAIRAAVAPVAASPRA
jgi:2-dehydro-3-deoxyphosphooctonate aldolase (KDO 8-P synthase)